MAKYHLDPKTISAVIEGYKAGMTYKSIMLQYHVNKNQIYYCVKKRCPEVLEGRVTLRKETKARFYQNTIYPLIDDFKAGAAVGTLAAHYHLTKHQVYCYLSSLCPQEYQAWLAAQKQEKQKRLDLLTLQLAPITLQVDTLLCGTIQLAPITQESVMDPSVKIQPDQTISQVESKHSPPIHQAVVIQ